MIHFKLCGTPFLLQFKIKPELHYGEVDCPVSTSESFPTHDELHFEIELIDFFKVKVMNIIFSLCVVQVWDIDKQNLIL